ncbi:MAG: TolC family protein [Deltaproteobacteria bacterium]|jgi:outer membrane protein TolC|nr:TolC family protein [Deltaproteobacteria bacterium]
MKYIMTLAISMALASITQLAQASEGCSINRASDVLNCALEQHPSLLQAKSQISISSINQDLANRWLSPSLEVSGGYNQEDDDLRGFEIDVAIMQPLETLTKRQARIKKAQTEFAAATTSLEGQKEITAFQVMTLLNRLRQIAKERGVLIEITKTFSDVIQKYKARPALTPEDKISLDLFQFAFNNYQLEKNQLAVEEKGYLNNLKAILNVPFSVTEKIFYYPPRQWPTLTSITLAEDNVDLAQERINIARARVDFLEAQASAFSGLSIGPYIQTRPGNVGRIDVYGLKFSLPLPLYSNAKPVTAGNLAVWAAEQSYEAKKRELSHSLVGLQEQYILGVSALKQYDIDKIEKQHAQIEELFKTGRVSGALLIEAHRQMSDNVKIYHQYELDTLQALWKIYAGQRKLLSSLNEVCYEK